MATKVGAKGQIVIEEPIRAELGIEPGMLAVQQVIDGAVVIRFHPAPHNRSLAGALRPYIRQWPSGDDVGGVIEEAWAEAAKERYSQGLKNTEA